MYKTETLICSQNLIYISHSVSCYSFIQCVFSLFPSPWQLLQELYHAQRLHLPGIWSLYFYTEVEINFYFIEQSEGANHELVSSLAPSQKYLSMHNGALLLKYYQFIFKNCPEVLAEVVDYPSFSLP